MEPQLHQRLAVVVREGLKGNHLLFAAHDLASAYAAQDDGPDGRLVLAEPIASEVGSTGLQLARTHSISEAREVIGGTSAPCRAALARLYLRFLARCAVARGDVN